VNQWPTIFAAVGVPEGKMEYRFTLSRRFRFDYAWPDHMIALEVEGGSWIGGRHTRGAGFARDMEKYNLATMSGWRILRCTPREMKTGAAARMVLAAIKYANGG